jgi:hypothetical protein
VHTGGQKPFLLEFRLATSALEFAEPSPRHRKNPDFGLAETFTSGLQKHNFVVELLLLRPARWSGEGVPSEGKSILLELCNQPTGWCYEAGYWAKISIETE